VAAAPVRLAVQADDLGGARAFTDGILRCHAAGAVTQASVITVAPDAARALRAAARAGLAVGVHLTLASEWPGARWRPLTDAPTLRAPDGALPHDIGRLAARASRAEASAELDAQVSAVGFPPPFVDCHQRVWDPDLLRGLCARRGVRTRDLDDGPESLGLGSVWHLSTAATTARGKRAALVRHVEGLPPGDHLVVAHPADDSPELDALCPRTSRRWKWARDIRLTDTAALLDADLPGLCAGRGVHLRATGAGGG
jgi:chitin disaccharide deacetylase